MAPDPARTSAGPSRQLGTTGAAGIGVGSMLGAGVFVVWGPAAAAAGAWLLVAVVLAAVVAVINAFSTAQLAALHPVAGGAYAYGARELSPTWGFVAGLGFVMGKVASVAAMGLAIGAYLWPGHAPVIATAVIGATWALNARGVTRTAWATTVIAVVVLVGLAIVVALSLSAPADTPSAAGDPVAGTPIGVASAAALIFFAFAGYARLATLGEEVRDARTTIPRAVAIAVAVVVCAYLVIGATLLRRPGAAALAGSESPLILALPEGSAWRAWVAVLAMLATGGALIALMAGIGRTSMAMAREGDLPRLFARTRANGVPMVAEATAGAAALAVAWWAGISFAVAMSSVSVLTYYAVANAAAFRARRRVSGFSVPRPVSAVGLVLCVALALSLERAPMLIALGLAVLAILIRAIGKRARRGVEE